MWVSEVEENFQCNNLGKGCPQFFENTELPTLSGLIPSGQLQRPVWLGPQSCFSFLCQGFRFLWCAGVVVEITASLQTFHWVPSQQERPEGNVQKSRLCKFNGWFPLNKTFPWSLAIKVCISEDTTLVLILPSLKWVFALRAELGWCSTWRQFFFNWLLVFKWESKP